MAVIVIRGRAKGTGSTGPASLRGPVSDVSRRAVAFTAAAVMVGAVGAALLQLVGQLLSFPAPVAVTGITVMAAALLTSLRRQLRRRSRTADRWPACIKTRPACLRTGQGTNQM
jgi:hypothetical protein